MLFRSPLRDGVVQPSLLTGSIQGLEPGGTPDMGWTLNGQRNRRTLEASHAPFTAALTGLRELLDSEAGLPAIAAVSHRVVHGGRDFRDSVVITDDILARLSRLDSLAPLHQPHNVAGIRAFREAFPTLPQIACFDTAFHADLPEVASRFALPRALHDDGVRRYGFHGLSYQYIMGTLQRHSPRANGRVLRMNSTINATSADLPMPWPEARAMRIGSTACTPSNFRLRISAPHSWRNSICQSSGRSHPVSSPRPHSNAIITHPSGSA